MREEVKMRQDKIKDDWAKEINGKDTNYKIGTFGYYVEKRDIIELNLASIKEAAKSCANGLHKKLFYDVDSGNFHFAPSKGCLKLIDILSIYKKLGNVRTELEKQGRGIIICNKTQPNHQPGHMRNLGEYRSYVNQLFSYIGTTSINGNKYELTAVRFSSDEENVVSCDIGVIQMIRMPKESQKSLSFYPKTIENHGKIEKFLENRGKDEKEYFYYNPELTIYDNVEDIAKKFIEFIIECEEKYKDK